MTEGNMEQLVRLGRSWTSPAAITTNGGLTQPFYQASERAYLMERSPKGTEASLTLAGSKTSPVINPAFVIRNWGEAGVKVSLDGKVIEEGPNCRIGKRQRIEGTDLILWLKMDREDKVDIRLTPAS